MKKRDAHPENGRFVRNHNWFFLTSASAAVVRLFFFDNTLVFFNPFRYFINIFRDVKRVGDPVINTDFIRRVNRRGIKIAIPESCEIMMDTNRFLFFFLPKTKITNCFQPHPVMYVIYSYRTSTRIHLEKLRSFVFEKSFSTSWRNVIYNV